MAEDQNLNPENGEENTTTVSITKEPDNLKELQERLKVLEEENRRFRENSEEKLSTADKIWKKHKEEENGANSFEAQQIRALDEITDVKKILSESANEKVLEVFEAENMSLKEKGIPILNRLESAKMEAIKYWLKDNESKLLTDEEKRAYIDIQQGKKEGFKILWNTFVREIELKKQDVLKERASIDRIKDPKNSLDKYESTFFKGVKRIKDFDGGFYVTN